MLKPTTSYRIDAADRIIWVGGDWSDFAVENDAKELASPGVIGESLWSYVDGGGVRQLYEGLFARLRGRGGTTEFRFRCDSPDRARFMTLRVAAEADETLRFDSQLEREVLRDPIPLLDPREPRNEARWVSICSMCLGIDDGTGSWLELVDAVTRLDLFSGVGMPTLSHGICTGCVEVFAEDR